MVRAVSVSHSIVPGAVSMLWQHAESVCVDHGIAAVEFLPDRLERLVAEPLIAVAGKESRTIRLSVSNPYSISLRVASTSASAGR